MIITIIVEPKTFLLKNSSKQNCQNALILVRALANNALMLIDTNDVIVNQIRKNIKESSDKCIRKVTKELIQVLKKNKCTVPYLNFAPDLERDSISLYKEIEKCTNKQFLDGIVINDNSQKHLEGAKITDNEIIPLKDYISSDIEEKRYNYAKFSETLDKIHPDKAKELISRCLWHTKKLSFFDKYIGALKLKDGAIDPNKSSNHLQKWLDGLSYILQLWHENDCFKKDMKTIDIYTGELFLRRSKNENWTELNKRHENIRHEAKEFINERLIVPLKGKFPWCNNINLHVKRDPKNIFRDRHLQTDNIILNFSKGFDLFYKSSFRCSYLSIKPDAASSLQDIRKLEEIN